MSEKVKVLFVCLGNICRSPAAEGAFTNLVQKKGFDELFVIDSAGTAGYHIGELPHETTRKVARERGIILSHFCRQFEYDDFINFDYILAMDNSNYQNIIAMARDESQKQKVMKFRKFDSSVRGEPDVPDPYYGGVAGFEHVQDIVERSSEGFLEWILQNHNISTEIVEEYEE